MAFFNSKKPIISAVGHEVDFLLSDLVADARAATPTQAVEMSIPDKETLLIDLKNKEKYIINILKATLNEMKKNLTLRIENYNLKKFKDNFNNNREKIIEREIKLRELIEKIIEKTKR